VKEFNHNYLSHVKIQYGEKRMWKSNILAFDHAYRMQLAQKEGMTIDMDQELYELEVQKTTNLGKMLF
jgi:hypothetical protein